MYVRTCPRQVLCTDGATYMSPYVDEFCTQNQIALPLWSSTGDWDMPWVLGVATKELLNQCGLPTLSFFRSYLQGPKPFSTSLTVSAVSLSLSARCCLSALDLSLFNNSTTFLSTYSQVSIHVAFFLVLSRFNPPNYFSWPHAKLGPASRPLFPAARLEVRKLIFRDLQRWKMWRCAPEIAKLVC